MGDWLPGTHYRSSRWKELCLVPTAVFGLPNITILIIARGLCNLAKPMAPNLAGGGPGGPGFHLLKPGGNPCRCR